MRTEKGRESQQQMQRQQHCPTTGTPPATTARGRGRGKHSRPAIHAPSRPPVRTRSDANDRYRGDAAASVARIKKWRLAGRGHAGTAAGQRIALQRGRPLPARRSSAVCEDLPVGWEGGGWKGTVACVDAGCGTVGQGLRQCGQDEGTAGGLRGGGGWHSWGAASGSKEGQSVAPIARGSKILCRGLHAKGGRLRSRQHEWAAVAAVRGVRVAAGEGPVACLGWGGRVVASAGLRPRIGLAGRPPRGGARSCSKASRLRVWRWAWPLVNRLTLLMMIGQSKGVMNTRLSHGARLENRT